MRRSAPIAVTAAVLAAAVATLPVHAAPAPLRPAAPAAQLRETETFVSAGVRFHRYQQHVGGIPVLGAQAVVTDAPEAGADLMVDRTRPSLKAPERPEVQAAEARDIAVARVGGPTLRGQPRSSPAILSTGAGPRLVWRVTVASARPLGSWEVLVDARTGDAVRVRDLIRHATGSAALFDPNPVERLGSRAGLADAGDADSPQLDSARSAVLLPRIADAGGCTSSPFRLSGQWARASLQGAEACPGNLDFTAVRRADDRFEVLMAYFHVDRAQAYIQSLGFANVLNRQLSLRANGAPGQPEVDNSYYDLLTQEITFGTGGTDDAEDGDVIVHEYGHAIQDAQVPGFGSRPEAGAMGEGFGDYLAAAMSATYSLGSPFDACIAEWDELGTAAPRDCLRRVDLDRTVEQVLAQPCSGEVHCAGEVWSSALWDIRAALGGAATDRLVLQSHFSLTADASFQDGSRALLAADAALYGAANRGFLIALLASRGLLDPERLDDSVSDANPLAVPGQAAGSIDASADPRDVFRLELTAGRGLIVRSSGPADIDLRLYAPGTTALAGGTVLGGSTSPGTGTEAFAFRPGTTGTYFLEVHAASGLGAYALETLVDSDGDTRPDGDDNCAAVGNFGQEDRDADGLGDPCDSFPDDPANDADRDGRGANADNCPLAPNAGQENWDRDQAGDACDRSARITRVRHSLRVRLLTVRAEILPLTADRGSARLLIERRVCLGSRCRYRGLATVKATRLPASGLAQFSFRAPRKGRYRFRLLLRDLRFEASSSPYVVFRVSR